MRKALLEGSFRRFCVFQPKASTDGSRTGKTIIAARKEESWFVRGPLSRSWICPQENTPLYPPDDWTGGILIYNAAESLFWWSLCAVLTAY